MKKDNKKPNIKLYDYIKDSNRKIVEEETTIYEVDNECILKNTYKKYKKDGL